MDAATQQMLVQRLVENPQDQAAISEAHAAGQEDPESYALLLERVGRESPDPAMAAHWLSEAGNVWITTFEDAHRAATVLMEAVERCPEADAPAQRLAQLYTENGDERAVVALAERRALAVADSAGQDESLRAVAARLLEELGQQRCSGAEADATKAEAAFVRALELNPHSQFAAYTLREMYKELGRYEEALGLYAVELDGEVTDERRLALLQDQSEVARLSQRLDVTTTALRTALSYQPADPLLRQQLATAILERRRGGEALTGGEPEEAAQLFVGLAEEFPGEHGFLYALCAMELAPGDDRACQLALHYGGSLGRIPEALPLVEQYLRANPAGAVAAEARAAMGEPEPKAAAGVSEGQRVEPEVESPHASTAIETTSNNRVVPEAAEAAEEDALAELLEAAAEYAGKNRKNQAIAAYKKALSLSPASEEAIAYLLQALPPKRKYSELRDLLLAAVDAPDVSPAQQLGWLAEIAGLCERQLRDYGTAADAWRRIGELDPDNAEASEQYVRLLDKARRWDELAALLTRQAAEEDDLEVRIALERNLAKLHADKRKDLVSAGEAWGRIAELTPGDEAALLEAVRLFERAEALPRVIDIIARGVGALDDPEAQREMYIKLGTLRAQSGDVVGAADALAEGAGKLEDGAMWAQAQEYYASAGQWSEAANMAQRRQDIASSPAERAALAAVTAEYLFNGGEDETAFARLEEAVDWAPAQDEYASELERRLDAAGRTSDVAALLLGRAKKLEQAELRIGLRNRAARLLGHSLGDLDAARDAYALALEDGEDPEALRWLADDSERLTDYAGTVEYLARLAAAVTDADEKLQVLHREAELVRTQLGDPDGAIERLEAVLAGVDSKDEQAFRKLAAIEEEREGFEAAARVLERWAQSADEREVRLEVWGRLADLYERRLDSSADATRVLQRIHEADPDDLDATERLCSLARRSEKWELVASLMEELIAVEGDEEEISVMTRELAAILSDRLSRASDALETLGRVADGGDAPCRDAFIQLGDSIGEEAIVARRIVFWWDAKPPTAERKEALHGAFERFVDAGCDGEAAMVAKDLAGSGNATAELAPALETIAVKLHDLKALSIAHALKLAELDGLERGDEAVRQAEVLATLDVPEAEVLAHGEAGLSAVQAADAEPLLARLAELASSDATRVDLYERQVARCAGDEERMFALCRAAEVATELDLHERAGAFFDVALKAGVSPEAVDRIIAVARRADEKNGDKALRLVLAEALAGGGQGARDGGRTRSYLLRRAAVLAHDELDDRQKSEQWMADALVTYVEIEGLDTLLNLAAQDDDFKRAEAVLERALSEVFDGPMVRLLLACRAELRETQLGDKKGAARDLKRLLDLAPGDSDVAQRLGELYAEVGDYRGIVQLYEDQILRGRDKERRAALAQRVALLWQNQLGEPREAADAWRRVLRLSPGNAEAKAGLQHAKEQMLEQRHREVEIEGSGPSATLTAAKAELAGADDEGPREASEAALSSLVEGSENTPAEVEAEAAAGGEPSDSTEATTVGVFNGVAEPAVVISNEGSTSSVELTEMEVYLETVEGEEPAPSSSLPSSRRRTGRSVPPPPPRRPAPSSRKT